MKGIASGVIINRKPVLVEAVHIMRECNVERIENVYNLDVYRAQRDLERKRAKRAK